MPHESKTILVSSINRCWNLQDTNRSICEVSFSMNNQNQKQKTLMAFSNDPNNKEIKTRFEMNIECDPDDLKRGICTNKNILQPIYCDPKSEKCDPYYIRNAVK